MCQVAVRPTYYRQKTGAAHGNVDRLCHRKLLANMNEASAGITNQVDHDVGYYDVTSSIQTFLSQCSVVN